ncbi:hypothetical protein TNCV_749441 [Trichonephila clavipes]|nr:hypothetical protein TNCV_749441 [Trichonephila clavipes]
MPPKSPHFEGLWEAGVKSVKHHLKRAMENLHFTFQEFETIMIQTKLLLRCQYGGHDLRLVTKWVRVRLPRNRDYTGMWVRLGSADLMAGKVMFLRSNQGGRFDGNESVADSFRSDLVTFKSSCTTILGAFSPLTSARKTSSREANSLPEVTPSVAPLLSDKYHPCKF